MWFDIIKTKSGRRPKNVKFLKRIAEILKEGEVFTLDQLMKKYHDSFKESGRLEWRTWMPPPRQATNILRMHGKKYNISKVIGMSYKRRQQYYYRTDVNLTSQAQNIVDLGFKGTWEEYKLYRERGR